MNHAAAVAVLAMVFTAACDRGTAPRGESGTNTAPVADKTGEKATTDSASSASARAERGSGTTATDSGGTTSGSGAQSTGSTTR